MTETEKIERSRRRASEDNLWLRDRLNQPSSPSRFFYVERFVLRIPVLFLGLLHRTKLLSWLGERLLISEFCSS